MMESRIILLVITEAPTVPKPVSPDHNTDPKPLMILRDQRDGWNNWQSRPLWQAKCLLDHTTQLYILPSLVSSEIQFLLW